MIQGGMVYILFGTVTRRERVYERPWMARAGPEEHLHHSTSCTLHMQNHAEFQEQTELIPMLSPTPNQARLS